MELLSRIKNNLLNHKPILLYDGKGRESEVDLLYYPKNITNKEINFMRKYGGGLICVAVSSEIADILGINYIQDSIPDSLASLRISKTAYGDKPAFSYSINHRSTYTGITDNDRATTISKFYDVVENTDRTKFLDEFYSPGHVFLLRAAKLLEERKGHTELSTYLTKIAGLKPTAVICEMLSDDGGSLSTQEAKEIADKNNYLFLETSEVVNLK